MSPKTAVLFGVATLAVLGVVAIFCPGQVLLVLLLLALGALLVGAIGFTLSLRQRLVIFALGILVAAGSAYGIMYLNGRAEERAIREKIAGQADEVKKLLADGYLYEAELRVSAIQEDQLKASNGELSGVAKSALAGLQSICDDWITQNFGKLSEPEIKLLMDFYRQFGSVTPKTRARRLRALKLTDRTAVSVTVAIDPIVPVPPESINREEQFKLSQLTTNDPVEAEAIRLFLAIFKKCPDAESISLKILSGDDNHELFDKTLDRKAILEMRQASSGSMKGGSGRVDPFAGRPANAGSK